MINAAFEILSETDPRVLEPCCDVYHNQRLPKIHIVYDGEYYLSFDTLKAFILNGMEIYEIQCDVMVMNIFMYRWNIITSEAMENYCKGKMYDKDSVNDDLESFFEAEIDGNVPERAF